MQINANHMSQNQIISMCSTGIWINALCIFSVSVNHRQLLTAVFQHYLVNITAVSQGKRLILIVYISNCTKFTLFIYIKHFPGRHRNIQIHSISHRSNTDHSLQHFSVLPPPVKAVSDWTNPSPGRPGSLQGAQGSAEALRLIDLCHSVPAATLMWQFHLSSAYGAFN